MTTSNMILRLIYNEQTKKPTSFKIGIFTVILVVTVMVMLTALTAVTPIIFISMAQQSVGSFDYLLTPATGRGSFSQGNHNYYNLDPFTYTGPPYENITN